MIHQPQRFIGLAVLGASLTISAAEVRVAVGLSRPSPDRIAINVGDTIAWEEIGPVGEVAHSIESFTGEWKSPPLINGQPPFKYSFNEAGFYAYKVLRLAGAPPYQPSDFINSRRPRLGTVTVVPWTNAPPAVTINSPVEGARYGWLQTPESVPILASVADSLGAIDRVEFYAETNLIGVATNTPYQMIYAAAALGTNIVTAKAIGKQTEINWSLPVTFIVEETPEPRYYSPRIVRGRLFAFDYVIWPLSSRGLVRMDELRKPWSYTDVLVLFNESGSHSGIFVDEVGTNQMRFYWSGITQP